jgi:hypothetical protein
MSNKTVATMGIDIGNNSFHVVGLALKPDVILVGASSGIVAAHHATQAISACHGHAGRSGRARAGQEHRAARHQRHRPKGTPTDIVAKLAGALSKALDDPLVQARYVEAVVRSPRAPTAVPPACRSWLKARSPVSPRSSRPQA